MVLHRKRSLAVWGSFLSILMACGAVVPEEPRTSEPPNVVLITLDTLRADFLGMYGGPPGLTPNIDQFARSSIVFHRASTSIGTTFPAHASIFTGLYPKAHGVRWNGDRLDDRFQVFPAILAEAGYDTAAFVSFTSLVERGGMDRGFERINPPTPKGDTILAGEQVHEMALPWLNAREEKPFFLWLHYFEAHSPYRLGSHAEEAFQRESYHGPLADGASTDLFYSLGREVPWTPAERWALRTLYAGEVAELDRLVGEIIARLRAKDLLQDTLVIITSDHGQALGEHDVVGHGFLLSEPVIRVPLILGGWRGLEGRTDIATRVGLVDIAPTLLDLAGRPEAISTQGRSIAPALLGESLPEVPYYAEVRDLRDSRRWSEADAAAIAVLDDYRKAIWRPDGVRWFDLDRDPGELEPGDSSIPEEGRRELRRLAGHYLADSTVEVDNRDGPTSEAIEELKSLGYIQ